MIGKYTLPVVPYLTDGGIYNATYNLNNLFTGLTGPLYSTVKNKNVNVCCVVNSGAQKLSYNNY